MPPFRPIGCKTKLATCVFPRLKEVVCLYYEFLFSSCGFPLTLIGLLWCSLCYDWPLWLLCFGLRCNQNTLHRPAMPTEFLNCSTWHERKFLSPFHLVTRLSKHHFKENIKHQPQGRPIIHESKYWSIKSSLVGLCDSPLMFKLIKST